jgi:hypothetical protein
MGNGFGYLPVTKPDRRTRNRRVFGPGGFLYLVSGGDVGFSISGIDPGRQP